ncbi:MAG: hypothetical protein RRY76_03330 [Clostridia bacterium]
MIFINKFVTSEKSEHHNKKEGIFKKMAENSVIIYYLTLFSASLYNWFANIFSERFFRQKRNEKSKNIGFFQKVFNYIQTNELFAKAKKLFANTIEGSGIVSIYRRLVHGFLCASVRSVAVFVFSFGLYTLAAYVIKIYAFAYHEHGQANAICIALCILVSIPMFFSKKSMAEKISESAICSFVLFKVLGINPLILKSKFKPRPHGAVAIVLGAIFGVLGFFVPPVEILKFVAIAIFVAIVIYSPESGLLTALMVMPLASVELLEKMLVLTLGSYIFKLLRGKRNINFSTADTFVLLFCVAILTIVEHENILTILMIFAAYFLVVNQIKSEKLLKNSFTAISIGLFVNMLLLAAKTILARFGILSKLNIETNILSFFANDEYLILISISVALMLFSMAEKHTKKMFAFVFILLTLFNALFSMSYAIWCGVLIASFVYFVFKTAKIFNVILAFTIAISASLLPLYQFSIYNEILPISFPNLIASENVAVLLFGGAKIGPNASFFQFILSSGGLFVLIIFVIAVVLIIMRVLMAINISRTPSVRIMCGAFLSIIAIFIYVGFLRNSMGNEKMMIIFWTFTGMTVCCKDVFNRAYEYE